MILVTFQLLPGGDPLHRRTIATMEIANQSDLADCSDYTVDISEEANRLAGTRARWCTVTVRSHDRRQSVLKLVAAAIQESIGANWDET